MSNPTHLTPRRKRPLEAKPLAQRGIGAADSLAFLALLVVATETYRPLGYILGFPTSTINLAFSGIFAIYVIARSRDLWKLVNTPVGRNWVWAMYGLFMLMLALQVIARLVSIERAVYWSGFTALFAVEFAAAVALWARHGSRLIKPFFLSAIGLTWLGFVTNLANDAFIRQVLRYSSNDIGNSESYLRLLGFYPHPNTAGLALCIFFSCLITDRRFMDSNLGLQTATLCAVLAGVVLTGSRTSLLLLSVAVLWYVVTILRLPGQSVATALRVVATPPIIFGTIALAILGIGIVVGPESAEYANIITRVSTLFTDLSTDSSVGSRVSILDTYVAYVQSSPILGFGPDFAAKQIESGTFGNVSQNAWLEWAMKSGVVYPVVVIVTFFSTLMASKRNRDDAWSWRRACLLITILTIASFSFVNLLWLRAPICAMGMLLGVIFHQVHAHGQQERV